jgi:very-short-patch-repair endonuclease
MPRGQHFAAWLRGTGHVAHTSAAYERGFTKRDIADAVAQCGVARVRRSWLATLAPNAPTRRALAIGGRLTCISEAHRLGVWVPEVTEPHVWVDPRASRFAREGMRIHRAVGPSPIAPTSPREPLINVLFQVARCLAADDALTVWESALRTTSLTKEMLQEVPWKSTRARRLSDAAGGLSDSGLETHVVTRLRRAGLAVRQQVWLDGHPVDALVGRRLVIQIDGRHHLEPRQRRRDIEADARLTLMGFTVLRFDYRQVMFDWPHVERTVLTAVAQGRHL